MCEPEVFQKQMYYIEEVLVTLLGLFCIPHSHLGLHAMIQHLGNCTLLAPLVTPLDLFPKLAKWVAAKYENEVL